MKTEKMRTSVGIRVVIIAAISLVLMIPAFMMYGLIHERESTRNRAVREVSEKWGGSQTIAGPVLSVPFMSYHKDENGSVVSRMQFAHFLPDELNIDGVMQPEIRNRGLYQVVLYGSKLHLSGRFSVPDMSGLPVAKDQILWKDAFISFGISDMKGIRDNLVLKWNGAAMSVNPGIPSNDVLASGVSAPISLAGSNQSHTFSIDINLNGAQELNFIPVGKENTVSLASKWSTPSFQGNFLPETRSIGKDGFTAQWKVLQLNRNYPQKWVGNPHQLASSAFGVNLVKPVDGYQKTMRTTKYALMFVVLTFAAFFVIELLNNKYVHPIQYFLVGLALIIFYTLLLSLSEHISFQASYLAATLSTVILIGAYCKSLFNSKRLAAVITALISGLYGFLYILLQLEDYALLMGSVGLFVVLAIFMYLTRKIEWGASLQAKA